MSPESISLKVTLDVTLDAEITLAAKAGLILEPHEHVVDNEWLHNEPRASRASRVDTAK